MYNFSIFINLLRVFAIAVVTTGANAAWAQDSFFKDFDAYEKFVDTSIMARDFIPLIQQLGGRDEYTKEQLDANNAQLLNVFRANFTGRNVFKVVDLEGGVRQEARMYWIGTSYAFYYAMLHQREDGLVVLRFALNSSSDKIMGLF